MNKTQHETSTSKSVRNINEKVFSKRNKMFHVFYYGFSTLFSNKKMFAKNENVHALYVVNWLLVFHLFQRLIISFTIIINYTIDIIYIKLCALKWDFRYCSLRNVYWIDFIINPKLVFPHSTFTYLVFLLYIRWKYYLKFK